MVVVLFAAYDVMRTRGHIGAANEVIKWATHIVLEDEQIEGKDDNGTTWTTYIMPGQIECFALGCRADGRRQSTNCSRHGVVLGVEKKGNEESWWRALNKLMDWPSWLIVFAVGGKC